MDLLEPLLIDSRRTSGSRPSIDGDRLQGSSSQHAAGSSTGS
jgi:hypothetical protein